MKVVQLPYPKEDEPSLDFRERLRLWRKTMGWKNPYQEIPLMTDAQRERFMSYARPAQFPKYRSSKKDIA